MLHSELRSSCAHVLHALREPAGFARRWQTGESTYSWIVFIALGATAVMGTTTYGSTMGLLGGPSAILQGAVLCTLAAGLAWGIALPALYVFNSLTGSRLPASTTLLAALVTTSWGGLAMVASIPINWFFTVAFADLLTNHEHVIWLVRTVNIVVFTGVGVAMIDIFGRVMKSLEPERGRWPVLWLLVVGAIGAELFYAFGLFTFAAR